MKEGKNSSFSPISPLLSLGAGLGSLALVLGMVCWVGKAPVERVPLPSPVLTSAPAPTARALPLGGQIIRLLSDGTVMELPLEEYVLGVVAAEMPAAFQPAALEAQAVAARTYALRRMEDSPHSPDAHVCCDPGCCQGYAGPENRAALWGEEAGFYGEKLRTAVENTAGQALRYEGALIEAAYHAASQGQTADAAAVWGSARPYLVSVNTPEGEEVPNFQTEVIYTPKELQNKMGLALSGDPASWLGEVRYHPWGGVYIIQMGDASLTGEAVRQALGLRSSRFTVSYQDGRFVFRVTGYGHGVGMSQWGANAMAKEGRSYGEILAHYYPGTELVIS